MASAGAVTPGYTTYQSPAGLGNDSGEPSVGVNWATGRVMFQAGLETLQVSNFGAGGSATWKDVSSTLTSTVSLDPILFTDHFTNRTFVSQLTGGCSLMAFTDTDGEGGSTAWTQNPVGCGIAAAADHQTVGGGHYAPGLVSGIGYPDTVYYCAQAVVSAQCARSDNGGLSFGPGVSIYNATQCGGLHGHIKAAPDGTVYVPNADCGGKAGAAVSADNGLTWTVRTIPGSSTPDHFDPSIGIGNDGTVYMGYTAANGHPKIAVSTNRGVSWSASVDVGTAFGIQNTEFPSVVAGAGNKAAFAFLGTPTAGDDQADSFTGVWHLYIATTFDRGATWTTVDATPGDPVQRGCIWAGGGSNPCRNLLDFMDVAIDATGHVVVGFADGCISAQCIGASGTPSDSRAAKATIAYQTSGDPLLP